MKTEYTVSGMHCPSCPKLIKMNIEELDGIKKVDADEKSGIVKVEYDEKKTNSKEIAKKIAVDGYKITKTK